MTDVKNQEPLSDGQVLDLVYDWVERSMDHPIVQELHNILKEHEENDWRNDNG
mgnify:CR=1 FL=1|tara:strand:- start:194 stop:352 length:159 start_codon:yes stop_codon:yes gene_type:complete